METRLDGATIYSRQRWHHKDVISSSSVFAATGDAHRNFLFPNCALNLVS
jgi:hypothetical protein